ncbi:Protein odr-4-like protein [Microtus ochrogaster]|uniref:Protein odr-4 homolog n=1 Tax=Microtus ochrogaster TaxID=79684 RepID=A0A8J6H153_MICOH|nr:Protein odr-4-like protein [Microtus ochrogaster]
MMNVNSVNHSEESAQQHLRPKRNTGRNEPTVRAWGLFLQPLSSDHRSTATVQICSGSVNLRGDVKCRAFIHSNRPKVKDAVQAVKRDILNTVAERCEILFEDLLLNETPEKKSAIAAIAVAVLAVGISFHYFSD